jgi:hypothetical protein
VPLCLPPAPAAALARCILLARIDQVREVWVADLVVAFATRARRAALRALVPPGIPLVPQSGADLDPRVDHVLTALPAAG